MECRFCSIETKEPERVVHVGEHCVVMFSNPRLMPGHLLVIPKRHVLDLSALENAERKELFDTAISYQEKILKNIASGCDIRQHNRPFLPENDLKVDHVHLHLQPREYEDELYLNAQVHERTLFKPLKHAEIERMSELLQ